MERRDVEKGDVEKSDVDKRNMESSRVRAKPDGERDELALLIAGLDESVPGLEVVDRELVFEGGARADLVAVDPSGRLYLVQRANQDGNSAVLDALDAVALLLGQLEVLVRHCGESRVNAERAPRLLVVCAGSDARTVERLSALTDAGVLVLGSRTVKSATGEHRYLVRLDPVARAAVGPSGVAAFLRALRARLEPLGAALVERMGRLDEELAASGDATTLVWRLSGEVLAKVERIGDLLQASVAPRHEPLPLAELADLERLVEKALGRLVRVLGLTRAERPEGGPERSPTRTDEPLLTPEEIQAFRE
jgi:hypothetical protein